MAAFLAVYPLGKRVSPKHMLNVMVWNEKVFKGYLFNCQMCGQCILHSTGMTCPMTCPKNLRNGPCGGSTSETCYVDTTRPCIWYKIYERSFQFGREELLLEVLPPLDWEKVGQDSWRDVFRSLAKMGVGKAVRGLLSRSVETRKATWDGIFRPVRQPDWWQGDAKYHAPAYHEPVSELERRLVAGEFVVTSEVSPPFSSHTDKLIETIKNVKPFVTALNFTDNASATPRMSSSACCQVALQHGGEPVLQISARNRSRSNLQSEVIGATALGVGERVGNAEMDLLIVNLKLLGAHQADIRKLPEYCKLVAEAVGVPIPVNYPVVGTDAFRTGTEALHGVAWLGPATVFPQAIGLATSWNPELVRAVGAAVGGLFSAELAPLVFPERDVAALTTALARAKQLCLDDAYAIEVRPVVWRWEP